jgi:hypothetical protein
MAASETKKIPFRLKSEVPHCRSLWVGILQGTWKEMGIQYGRRCGKDIARNFDIHWEKGVLKGNRPFHKGRTEEERAVYFLAYLRRSFKELACLKPELVEMLEGIGEGAARELDTCVYAKTCTHFEKVALMNYSSTKHLHPDWDFENDRPKGEKTPEMYAELFTPTSETEECNGFWVKGDATQNGHVFATRTAQGPHVDPYGSGKERQVSYVAIPKDPNARVFWGYGKAGNLGGLGGGLMNDLGVCCLTSGAQYAKDSWAQADVTVAPGIRDFLLAICGVIFSKTAREAAEMATVGTEDYRKKTGRKTVLRARGCNIVFVDQNEAYCVEQNARRYAVRRPGDFGEKENNYIVHANHFKYYRGSFDENNVFAADAPMNQYAPELIDSSNGSYFRFWSGMWMLKNNYGKIDIDMVREELMPSHVGYDEQGNRFDPDPETGVPTVGDEYSKQHQGWHGTFCAHIKPYTQENPKGIGGNGETSVFNLSTLEVWWVPVWPCHYKDWNMDWNYLDLKPFSEYRRLLWGY